MSQMSQVRYAQLEMVTADHLLKNKCVIKIIIFNLFFAKKRENLIKNIFIQKIQWLTTTL